MTPATDARCQPHQAAATGTCTRCGAFVCDACSKYQADQRLCTACFARAGSAGTRAANVALLFSTFGLCLGVPGIVGLVLAQRELGRIRRGEAPEAAQATAELARAVGVASLLMLALAVVWVVRQLSEWR